MAAWTWDPFAEIEALRREIDRAFDTAGVDRGGSRLARASFLPGVAARSYPKVNLREDAGQYYVEALAPGVDPSSIDVTVERNTLRIAGDKLAPDPDKVETVHRLERAAGRFNRSVLLPAEVDAAGVKADYRNGLLRVTLPKAEVAKPRQIKVVAG